MAENLDYKTYSGSWVYDNDPSYADTYGRLYDWETACKACPPGWHLPSDTEWTVLIDYLGGKEIAGNKLKEAGRKHWSSPNEGATNKSRFSALPGGYYRSGDFRTVGEDGSWWSSTEYSSTSAWRRNIGFDDSDVGRGFSEKDDGRSVRCLRD